MLSRPLTFSSCVRAACLPGKHDGLDQPGFCIYPKLCDFDGTRPIGHFSRLEKHRLYVFSDDECEHHVPEAQTTHSLCGKTTVSMDNYANIIDNGPPLICEHNNLWYLYGIGAYHRKVDEPPFEWITFVWQQPTAIRSFINTYKDKQADNTHIQQELLDEISEQHTQTIISSYLNVDYIMDEVLETPSESRRLLIDRVTDAIIEAHMATTINTHSNVDKANERIARMKKSNNMPDPSLNSTLVWEHFHSSMEPEMTKLLQFCKKLPGFSEIEKHDQVLLIKNGAFEVMAARFCILVDDFNEMMFDPDLLMKSPRFVIREMPIGPFLDIFFQIAKYFNSLGLSDAEIGLFTAILIICPDREGLRNYKFITTIQKLYLQALYYYLKRGHKDGDRLFRSLLNAIPVFRKVSGDHTKFISSVKKNSQALFNEEFTLLHNDVFCTSS